MYPNISDSQAQEYFNELDRILYRNVRAIYLAIHIAVQDGKPFVNVEWLKELSLFLTLAYFVFFPIMILFNLGQKEVFIYILKDCIEIFLAISVVTIAVKISVNGDTKSYSNALFVMYNSCSTAIDGLRFS